MKMNNQSPIPWWQPYTGEKEKALVLEVLSSQYLNEGEYVDRFENAVKDLVKSRYAVATTSGTAALFLALKALGIGSGDEVIVPDITFIATANAVKLTGATPVLVDVNVHTLNLDLAAVRRAVSKKTRAVVPVHVSGRAVPMRELIMLSQEFELDIVEDAAEAFCSIYEGKALGTLGKLGCFSFSPNKTVSTGQGGMVVTDDEHLFRKLRELKDHGRPVRGTGGDDTHDSIGFNFKMTNLQAAIGIGQLERLSERRERMKEINLHYQERLADMEELSLFPFGPGEIPQWTDARSVKRDILVSFLKARGVHCRKLWHPLHTQKPYHLSNKDYPVAMQVGYEAFWLPSSFFMTHSEQERVCHLIRDFFSESVKMAA